MFLVYGLKFKHAHFEFINLKYFLAFVLYYLSVAGRRYFVFIWSYLLWCLSAEQTNSRYWPSDQPSPLILAQPAIAIFSCFFGFSFTAPLRWAWSIGLLELSFWFASVTLARLAQVKWCRLILAFLQSTVRIKNAFSITILGNSSVLSSVYALAFCYFLWIVRSIHFHHYNLLSLGIYLSLFIIIILRNIIF